LEAEEARRSGPRSLRSIAKHVHYCGRQLPCEREKLLTALAPYLEGADGFAQLADPSVSGLPAGVTASFDPPHLAAGQTAVRELSVGGASGEG